MLALNPDFKPPADYKYDFIIAPYLPSLKWIEKLQCKHLDNVSALQYAELQYCLFSCCRPPATRVSDKVMIPQDEYPEINFVGLLIGPR